jgi:RNA polymerase sigma-70 factor (ECF subfamily)
MLYRLARRAVDGDAAAAEDVVQETWLRAVERLSAFRGDSALRTWLAGFTLRIARERSREDPTGDSLDVAVHEDRAGVEDVRLRGTFARVDLERAVSALPPGCRQVLWLHDVEGFTHEEIARLLGIVPGTSKSQLARARATLRRALSDGG